MSLPYHASSVIRLGPYVIQDVAKISDVADANIGTSMFEPAVIVRYLDASYG